MIKVKETVNIFIDHLREEGKSHSTLLAYGKDIEQFLELLNILKVGNLKDLEEDHVKLFLEKLKRKNYTPKSISRKLNSIRTFCKIMTKLGHMDNNPSSVVSHPKIKDTKPRVLSQMEFRALRDACKNDTRLYTIVETMLQTGIRIGELARLELQDLELDNKERKIYIKAYSSNKDRYIPLNDAAINTLKTYFSKRLQAESTSVFITKTGRPLLVRNIRTSINRAFRNAGISNAKVNDLRNTFIAHNLAQGASLLEISKIVGHKRISTTEKYLGLVKEENKKTTKLKEL